MTPAAPMAGTWGAIEAASRRDAAARVPFTVGGAVVGSVARGHLDALRDWPRVLAVGPRGVALLAAEGERDAALAPVHRALQQQGLIRAWRDETYALVDPATRRVLARIERAASRFWGVLTFGAHGTGYVAGASGRPEWLWIAQRSFTKATDPGAHDNLVGGGVPAGQTPFETLVREGWEEAGLDAAVMRRARPGRVMRLERDIPEGLQFEWIHGYDLELAPGELPHNRDGEVHTFERLPLADAAALAAGTAMTVDAALVTLDFLLRHRLLPVAEHEALAARAAGLWVGDER